MLFHENHNWLNLLIHAKLNYSSLRTRMDPLSGGQSGLLALFAGDSLATTSFPLPNQQTALQTTRFGERTLIKFYKQQQKLLADLPDVYIPDLPDVYIPDLPAVYIPDLPTVFRVRV